MSTVLPPIAIEGEFAWEVATLFPEQGEWSEEEYLSLTDSTNRHIEFAEGHLEFLPMPTEIHQELVEFLFLALHRFLEAVGLGKVHTSGLRVRVPPNRVREPDLIFLNKESFHKRHNRVWDGADLVMEVVSGDPKDRKRDYETKLVEYAAGGIAEYWIVDPERRVVLVHRLDGKHYVLHGEFKPGDVATSTLLDGFTINVTELFAAADDVPQ